jgi:hypothetical protein
MKKRNAKARVITRHAAQSTMKRIQDVVLQYHTDQGSSKCEELIDRAWDYLQRAATTGSPLLLRKGRMAWNRGRTCMVRAAGHIHRRGDYRHAP